MISGSINLIIFWNVWIKENGNHCKYRKYIGSKQSKEVLNNKEEIRKKIVKVKQQCWVSTRFIEKWVQSINLPLHFEDSLVHDPRICENFAENPFFIQRSYELKIHLTDFHELSYSIRNGDANINSLSIMWVNFALLEWIFKFFSTFVSYFVCLFTVFIGNVYGIKNDVWYERHTTVQAGKRPTKICFLHVCEIIRLILMIRRHGSSCCGISKWSVRSDWSAIISSISIGPNNGRV